jgi:hypothetical protein
VTAGKVHQRIVPGRRRTVAQRTAETEGERKKFDGNFSGKG